MGRRQPHLVLSSWGVQGLLTLRQRSLELSGGDFAGCLFSSPHTPCLHAHPSAYERLPLTCRSPESCAFRVMLCRSGQAAQSGTCGSGRTALLRAIVTPARGLQEMVTSHSWAWGGGVFLKIEVSFKMRLREFIAQLLLGFNSRLFTSSCTFLLNQGQRTEGLKW